MTDYLVFNDVSGAFVSADEIQAIFEHSNGSRVLIKGNLEPLNSPLKPRELLRRLTIMRFKRENGESTGHPNSNGKTDNPSATAVSGKRGTMGPLVQALADE